MATFQGTVRDMYFKNIRRAQTAITIMTLGTTEDGENRQEVCLYVLPVKSI
jgi:hypothetical protein